MDNQLYFIQQLHSEGLLNDDQRDNVKDMCFDEDTTLLSFFANADPEDLDSLKTNIIKYIGGGVGAGKHLEDAQTSGDSLEEISSPQDNIMDMKKKKRLQAL